jgi:ATP-dependent Clp protease ATP-binding subunit ClpX
MTTRRPPPSPPELFCSFCYASAADVDALVAGPGVYICGGCVHLAHKAVKGETIPSFPPLADREPDELLARLGPATFAATVAERSLRDQIDVLRDKGVSWARIGDALGTSRQAAWERFSNRG